MGGQIRRGRIWRFLGRPKFSVQRSPNTYFLDELQITHLICACLKYDLYDFLGGALGPLNTRRRTGSEPKTPLKKSYRSYFRRAQIR